MYWRHLSIIIGNGERVATTTQFSDESSQVAVVNELIGGAWGEKISCGLRSE